MVFWTRNLGIVMIVAGVLLFLFVSLLIGIAALIVGVILVVSSRRNRFPV